MKYLLKPMNRSPVAHKIIVGFEYSTVCYNPLQHGLRSGTSVDFDIDAYSGKVMTSVPVTQMCFWLRTSPKQVQVPTHPSGSI